MNEVDVGPWIHYSIFSLLGCTFDQPNFRQAAGDFDVAHELDPKVHPKLEERRFFWGVEPGVTMGFLVLRTGNGLEV